MGGVFPIYHNITWGGGGGSLGTPNLYYVMYGRPLRREMSHTSFSFVTVRYSFLVLVLVYSQNKHCMVLVVTWFVLSHHVVLVDLNFVLEKISHIFSDFKEVVNSGQSFFMILVMEAVSDFHHWMRNSFLSWHESVPKVRQGNNQAQIW